MADCAECQVEQKEHNQHNDWHDDREARHRALLVLELAAVLDEISWRQFDLFIYSLANIRDNAAEVSSPHIALNYPTALVLLAVDLDRAERLIDSGHL